MSLGKKPSEYLSVPYCQKIFVLLKKYILNNISQNSFSFMCDDVQHSSVNNVTANSL